MHLELDELPLHFFQPLQQTDFQTMQHAASLKGFLKPFKGKRALIDLDNQCELLRSQLISLAKEPILKQLKVYPFSLLPIQLGLQTTGAGTAFLRWRKVDRSVMGVQLWNEILLNPSTPAHLINDLYAIELQRIILNMQISLVHTIRRQACDCAEKMAHAEAVYQQRIMRNNP